MEKNEVKIARQKDYMAAKFGIRSLRELKQATRKRVHRRRHLAVFDASKSHKVRSAHEQSVEGIRAKLRMDPERRI